jgi:hypothetical protein
MEIICTVAGSVNAWTIKPVLRGHLWDIDSDFKNMGAHFMWISKEKYDYWLKKLTWKDWQGD